MISSENSSRLQVFLDPLDDVTAVFGDHVASSNNKVPLQNWNGPSMSLVALKKQMREMKRCSYLGGCLSPDNRLSREMSSGERPTSTHDISVTSGRR